MNRHLYTTDEFGRSADQDSSRYDIWKAFTKRDPYVRAYDRYFEGYEAVLVPRGNGRGVKAVRVYKGTLYRPVLTKYQRRNRRLSYAALYFLAAALFFWALMLPVASNSVWYVVLGAIVFVFFLGRLLLALNLYLFSGKDLTVHEYRDGACKLTQITGYIDRVVFIPVIATGVFFILEAGSFNEMELLRLFLLVLSANVAKMIGRQEGKAVYTAISSEEKKERSRALRKGKVLNK